MEPHLIDADLANKKKDHLRWAISQKDEAYLMLHSFDGRYRATVKFDGDIWLEWREPNEHWNGEYKYSPEIYNISDLGHFCERLVWLARTIKMLMPNTDAAENAEKAFELPFQKK